MNNFVHKVREYLKDRKKRYFKKVPPGKWRKKEYEKFSQELEEELKNDEKEYEKFLKEWKKT